MASLGKRMLVGRAIGLTLISAFLISAGEGGAFNYLISRQKFRSDWAKWLGMLLSLIVFIIWLWLGAVLGLDGTYWN